MGPISKTGEADASDGAAPRASNDDEEGRDGAVDTEIQRRAESLGKAHRARQWAFVALPACPWADEQRASLRSFDHYFGALGRPDVDGIPPSYRNVAIGGNLIPPMHATTTCIAPDVPHDWGAMHQAWNGGKNDGFYVVAAATGPAARAMEYYEPADLPFYSWLAQNFAISDRFLSAVLGPTTTNRRYLYAASTYGDEGETNNNPPGKPSIFSAMNAANVGYGLYSETFFLYGYVGVTKSDPHAFNHAALFAGLAAGKLPRVVFIDAPDLASEHPPQDITVGEGFLRKVVLALFQSPLWSTSALVITYDESGGFLDHVPPPAACPPSDATEDQPFNRLGFRVPLIVVSPYARGGKVSH